MINSPRDSIVYIVVCTITSLVLLVDLRGRYIRRDPMSIDLAIEAIKSFQGASLTKSLSDIERDIVGLGVNEIQILCGTRKLDDSFLASALSIKKVAAQINVIIHAASILHALQSILEPGELIENVSLGAGNTGRKFELETNFRVAEFKFIDWQGGSETIRQNSIFKDFYELAEYETPKRKFLYVIGTDFSLRFFRGARALTSVLSRPPAILAKIHGKYGTSLEKVCDYYGLKKQEVAICDVSPHVGRTL